MSALLRVYTNKMLNIFNLRTQNFYIQFFRSELQYFIYKLPTSFYVVLVELANRCASGMPPQTYRLVQGKMESHTSSSFELRAQPLFIYLNTSLCKHFFFFSEQIRGFSLKGWEGGKWVGWSVVCSSYSSITSCVNVTNTEVFND